MQSCKFSNPALNLVMPFRFSMVYDDCPARSRWAEVQFRKTSFPLHPSYFGNEEEQLLGEQCNVQSNKSSLFAVK